MRRIPLVAVVVSLVLAGCARGPEGPGGPAGTEDVLFVRTDRSVTLVRGLPDGHAVRLSGAVPSLDWSAVVQASTEDRVTTVTAVETSSGEGLWSQDVDGRFEAKVSSRHGALVALGETRHAAYGRRSTTLVVVGEASEPRFFELDGNFEPEAFSTDGGSLFVIEYLPPTNPDSYRVRRLDLTTGEVVAVYTPDAHLQEAMEGNARIQAASPDGRRLYTLYSFRDTHGVRHAFIHVLDLDELWAHCIDLPSGFATSPQKAMALTVSPGGDRVYLADAAADVVAEVDTGTLSVVRTADVDFGVSGFPAQIVLGTDDVLYLSSGTRLLAVDPTSLSQRRSWYMTGDITGLQPSSDGSRLYVGLKDGIVMIDTASGRMLGTLTPADLGQIGQLGRSTRLPGEPPTDFTCAC
jgi:outer membrane protein assembly factor BamB